jgi:nucleoside-diphosphate-sugar epimerase
VSVVCRNKTPRYSDPRIAWPQVEWVVADRRAEEQEGTWQARMANTDAEIVIDLICFTPEQNRMMVEAFEGRISHFLTCGSIWAYGPSPRTPYHESDARRPISDYGRGKAAIEADLTDRFHRSGFPATVVHPGHISGRKWLPIDPQGTRNGTAIYGQLAGGDVVHLPQYGRETLHHVHGDDVAQVFELALTHREAALGESFSAVAPYAMSLVGCCQFVASLFGRAPNLAFVTHAEFEALLGAEAAAITFDHVQHSPCSSIEKGLRLLGYQPRYTTEQIYVECIEYMLASGTLSV